MDVHSQLVAYICHIPVWIIQVLRFLAVEDVSSDCSVDILFLSSRGLLVRERGGVDPDWLQSWYRICLSAGQVTNQETNSWTQISSQMIFEGLGVEDLEAAVGGPVASCTLPFPLTCEALLRGFGVGWILSKGWDNALPIGC